MAETIISVTGLGKRYVLGAAAERTLIGSIQAVFDRNAQAPRGKAFWALQDVSFDVAAGEVIGVVGDNGAGKSTLLKILSRITEPTTGSVRYRGRLGSLLEVGTGFHPELSGRDNVFLNGAILGMREREIAARLDEIVAFAEVEAFIDTPVKRYSSGMYLRLAFAVAAYLETDILLIDEVLAVGDVKFQRKCLARMDEVARNGRTVVFVSHNLAAVQALCQRVVWLAGGKVQADGPTREILSGYLRTSVADGAIGSERIWEDSATAPGDERLRIRKLRVGAVEDGRRTPIDIRTPFSIVCEYQSDIADAEINVSFSLYDEQGVLIFDVGPTAAPTPMTAGLYRDTCRIPGDLLNNGVYRVDVIVRDRGEQLLELPNILSFDVLDSDEGRHGWFGEWRGVLRPRLPWTTERL